MHVFSLLIAEWFRQNGRDLPWRSTTDPYYIWLSEIILQQTRVTQGRSYYQKFIVNYPTVQDLARASEQDILNDWQGLGYYSRARNLHFTAKYVAYELNGKFPDSYDGLLQLKGVGSYTAAAIASFAFNREAAVVDGNVYRFLSRAFDLDTPIDSTPGKKQFQELADVLIKGTDPAIHNQAMMEMGSIVCKPQPDCAECPVREHCISYSRNTVQERPVKSKKTKVRNRYFHYMVFESKEKTIVRQRTKKDVWQHLYEFPLIETEKPEVPELPELTELKRSEKITHILSHQRIEAVFYHFNGMPSTRASDWKVIDRKNIQDFPLPRIIDRYLEQTAG